MGGKEINTKNELQELAEKAAGFIDGLMEIFVQESDGEIWVMWPQHCFANPFFSWPVVGLMIEHLQEKGFELWKRKDRLWFGDGPRETKRLSINGYGYHIAITKAFVEACEIIEGEK